MPMSLTSGGKFRLLRQGVLEHWCPGCCEAHPIDIHAISRNGHVTGWDGDLAHPTIGEPVRHETARGLCEYRLKAGILYFASDCWHPLANQFRHLEEFHR